MRHSSVFLNYTTCSDGEVITLFDGRKSLKTIGRTWLRTTGSGGKKMPSWNRIFFILLSQAHTEQTACISISQLTRQSWQLSSKSLHCKHCALITRASLLPTNTPGTILQTAFLTIRFTIHSVFRQVSAMWACIFSRMSPLLTVQNT